MQIADEDLHQRLLSIPGVGPITTSVLAAEMGDGQQYWCSRDFAATAGLVPRQYGTGGRNNLLGIRSKRGDQNLRRLLVQCARAYVQRLERQIGRPARRLGGGACSHDGIRTCWLCTRQ
jgi:transposase